MYLLFDIGGSKMRIGYSGNGDVLDEFRVIPTPQDYEEGMTKFVEIANEIKHGAQIKKVAGGITGILNKDKATLFKSPHLLDWAGKPLKERISQLFQSEVIMENDSALVGMGEANFGAGRGFKIIAYLTISTGIGGARIVDGKVDVNTFGFEPGHQIIDADGTIYPDFNPENTERTKGEFESLASGSAINKRFGQPSYELNDDSAWSHINWLFAQGICNSILHWSPEVVVIGGGVTESEKFSLDQINGYMNEILKMIPERPQLKKAELSDLGGLHGGLSLIKSINT